MLKLPSFFTLFRLFLSPLFLILFLLQQWWLALGVAVLFEISDLLDGFVARRYRMMTPLGKLVDPLADTVSRFSAFLAFVTAPSLRVEPWPVLLTAILFYSDAVVAYVRVFAASTGTVMAARPSGKVNAVLQGLTIVVIVLARALATGVPALAAYLPTIYYGFMVPVAAVTVCSCTDYVAANWDSITTMAAAETEQEGNAPTP